LLDKTKMEQILPSFAARQRAIPTRKRGELSTGVQPDSFDDHRIVIDLGSREAEQGTHPKNLLALGLRSSSRHSFIFTYSTSTPIDMEPHRLAKRP
jgi:hypothetical protein